MEIITSLKNDYIKKVRSLSNIKYRREYGLFTVESEKCIGEALNYADIDSLLFCEEEENSVLVEKAAALNVRLIKTTREVIDSISDEKSTRGIILVAKIPEKPVYEKKGIVVALENVSDPVNIGAIIRTADAISASAVILSKACADYTSVRAIRSSMGSVFHIPVIRVDDLKQEIINLKAEGFSVVSGHLKGKDRLTRTENACLLIGNESRGLSDEISALSDELVKINMYGNAESLNASVAAGILMYRLKEGF